MTYEAALARAIQRTEAGVPTVPQRLHDGWVTRPVAFASDWPRGMGGKRIQTLAEATTRAKASTEAGRPQIVVAARSGGYRVRDVPFSMPVAKRGKKNIIIGRDKRLLMPPHMVKLSEDAVREARADYKAGRYSLRTLAKQLGVVHKTLGSAIRGITWADVA
jgi:hypothetical protein